MNTKEEVLGHLKEILEAEGSALDAYAEIAGSLKSEALKSFFMELSKEEASHAKIVKEMIALLEGGMQSHRHEPV